jgi:hypothetical protein
MPVFYAPEPPAVGHSETELIQRYLSKTRRYRRKEITLVDRCTVTAAENDEVYTPITVNAIRMSSRLSGIEAEKLRSDDFFVSPQKTYLWGFQNGFGYYDWITDNTNYRHYSTNLVHPQSEPKAGFYGLGASFFGDWNHTTNNLLRALLCTANYGYASMYFLETDWQLQPLALGDPIGSSFQYMLNRVPSANGHSVYLAILGDPTLRMQVLAPPKNLQAQVQQNTINLSWEPSPEYGIRYLVYRSANGTAGPFARLTWTPITTSVFSDASSPPGPKLYRVRAIKIISTGSGSFTNLSQGSFIQAN